jgi:uncharacterized protein (DUF58 family)
MATDLVTPETLAQLHHLDVVARRIVEGMQTGMHRSPHKGHSVDFADHRPYVAGDDLRHLDWKVLGRSDRLVLKRYEAETDFACHLVIDGSGSMTYQGERAAISKWRYASILAATLARVVLDQNDRVGLVVFSEGANAEVKTGRQGQFERICHALEAHQPAQGTDAAKGIEHLASPSTGRGLVVLISDCMVDPDSLVTTIDRLRHRGHDLVVMWLLDPDELDLGVATVSRFEGLESEGMITAEPRALRIAYEAEVANHRLAMQKLCRSRGAALLECQTSEAFHLPLNRLLVELNRGKK